MLRAYLRELRCADWYVQQLFGILRRAGRLHDTSVIITSDHGEGFELTAGHALDVVHGATVYETQARLPLVAFGPIARGLPKRIDGVWSDTTMAATLLDALLGDEGPQHILAPVVGRASADPPQLAPWRAPVLSLADLHGRSLLRYAHQPPQHTFVSCAFDITCVGLITQSRSGEVHKYIASGQQLAVYNLSVDTYEDHDLSHHLPAEARLAVITAMRGWISAVMALHRGDS